MGKRGTIVVPAKLRKRLGLSDGCFLLLTEKPDSFEIQLARLELAEPDGRRRQASSILSSAQNLGEYLAAIEEVRRMGLEPEEIPHERFSS